MGRPSKPITVAQSLAELKGVASTICFSSQTQDTNAHLKQTV
jgi:hypothetical protein